MNRMENQEELDRRKKSTRRTVSQRGSSSQRSSSYRRRTSSEREVDSGNRTSSNRRNSTASKRKNSKRRQQQKNRIILGAVFGSILLIGIITYIVKSIEKPTRVADINDGRQYLASLETKDLTVVRERIGEIRKSHIRESLESGVSSVWSQFYDYAVLGDSRAVGFSFYGFLDGNRVLAEAGNTIHDVPDKIKSVLELNPSNVYLCYGINDVSIGYYETPESYAKAMDETVQLIQSQLPYAKVYVNSIFPAQDPAFEQSEKWREIPDYNEAVKAMCEEKGYHYVDNNATYEEHKDLYDVDGIHFKPEMYDYWGTNMLTESLSVSE